MLIANLSLAADMHEESTHPLLGQNQVRLLKFDLCDIENIYFMIIYIPCAAAILDSNKIKFRVK